LRFTLRLFVATGPRNGRNSLRRKAQTQVKIAGQSLFPKLWKPPFSGLYQSGASRQNTALANHPSRL